MLSIPASQLTDEPVQMLSPQRIPAVRVRFFEHNDVERLRGVARRQHARTQFSDHAFSDRAFDRQVDKFFGAKRNQECIVAERHARIVGFAWFSIGPYLVCDDLKLTTVHALAVDRDRAGPFIAAKTFVRLVQGVKRWSEAQGGERVLIHVTTAGVSSASAERLLKMTGIHY